MGLKFLKSSACAMMPQASRNHASRHAAAILRKFIDREPESLLLLCTTDAPEKLRTFERKALRPEAQPLREFSHKIGAKIPIDFLHVSGQCVPPLTRPQPNHNL